MFLSITFSGHGQFGISTFYLDCVWAIKYLNKLEFPCVHLNRIYGLKMSELKHFRGYFLELWLPVYLDRKRKTTASCQLQQITAIYTISHNLQPYSKGEHRKMSSATPSLIFLWLNSSCGCDTVISSTAESWWKRLCSSGTNVPADGVPRLPRQLNWHYINAPCQGTECSSEENNNSAKLIALVESRWAKANFKSKVTFTRKGEKAFTVMNAKDFKSHLSLLTFNSMTDF